MGRMKKMRNSLYKSGGLSIMNQGNEFALIRVG